MAARRWDSETSFQFISLYREHECLWRVDCETYRDKRCRHNAMVAIIDAMEIPGLTVKEVKMKIKSLRSTYLIELKKIEDSMRSGASDEAVYEPKLPWFNLMDSFIKYVLVKRNAHNSKNEAERENLDENSASDPLTSLTPEAVPIEAPPAPKRPRHLARKPEVNFETNMRKYDGESEPEADEFDKFGIHVAEQLRKLSLEQAVTAFEEIQSTLSRCRLEDIRSKNSAGT